jgi:transcriptional regulator with XRE-family HTH domain
MASKAKKAARTEPKQRPAAVQVPMKLGRRRNEPDAYTGLRTGSTAPSETSARPLHASVGLQVRLLRRAIDLTVVELATAAGISAGMLSKIENGISPSLATLDSLAKALDVPITRLIADAEEHQGCSFVKSGAGARIVRRRINAGHLYDLLGHSLGGAIAAEPYLITLTEDAMPYTHFRHAGMEFIYMLSGKVRYRHGDHTYPMEAGDALFFDAAVHHGPEGLLEVPMRYLSIIIYPRETWSRKSLRPKRDQPT